MSENNTSASRVKAFRSRLSGQFKRVEAYVTEEEKAQIEEVKATLGVTTDVAVAGLVRLGLAQFQNQSASTPVCALAVQGALESANAPAAPASAVAVGAWMAAETTLARAPQSPQSRAVGASASLYEGVSASLSASGAARSLRSVALRDSAAARDVSAAPLFASMGSPLGAQEPVTKSSSEGDANPIAQFFKNRKEYSS